MSDVKHLVFAIIKFLEEQIADTNLSPEAAESLEVTAQCLESAYGLEANDASNKATYPLPASLPEIFHAGLANWGCKKAEVAEPTPDDKEAADRLKAEGNEFMKQEQLPQAIECYTRAIQLDQRNAVYYCNRAAAHNRLNDFQKAISDCNEALKLDNNYSKAYGRKGVAHSSLGQHLEARDAFVKAVELEPDNDAYKTSLEQAEQKYQQSKRGTPGPGPSLGGMDMGGMDFSALLNNPALMNMASSMLQNSQMQQMMSNMMASQGQASAEGPEGMGNLLQAGQQLAQQIQQSNPEMVEQLRSQLREPDAPSGEHTPDQSGEDGKD